MKKHAAFLCIFMLSIKVFANQIDFLNCDGKWAVYIDTSKENNIYSWDGEPLAYVDSDSNIYGFIWKILRLA